MNQINHKFTHEEVWSALEKCEYNYFIIGKEKDDEIVKQCGICSHRGSGELTEHIQSHFQLVSCKGKNNFFYEIGKGNCSIVFFKYGFETD